MWNTITANGDIVLLASASWAALVASAATGAAVSLGVWWLAQALRRDALEQGGEWRYDVSRIEQLRSVDWTYRLFQPAVQFLARLNRAAFGDRLRTIEREILAAGLPRCWLAEEYLARLQLLALLGIPIYVLACSAAFGRAGLVGVPLLVVLVAWLLRRNLARLARRRLLAIKRRLPFFLDLLTLLMGAGASFLTALKQAVREFAGQPVAEEFGRVLADINLGKPRSESFIALRLRLADEEIGSIVGAIVQSEQLGTPLVEVLRAQADVLQVKRSQRAETIAGEAGVNMLLPGVLVMAASVLVILGPFALNYLYFGWGL